MAIDERELLRRMLISLQGVGQVMTGLQSQVEALWRILLILTGEQAAHPDPDRLSRLDLSAIER